LPDLGKVFDTFIIDVRKVKILLFDVIFTTFVYNNHCFSINNQLVKMNESQARQHEYQN